ncbi:MAG TPA: glycosyltransferase family 2 protein [Hydrogenispora sp.]|jgi:glycosyltransferase involved in cell wall biosynthesis|nr:glycosyltransferase family 2 protein [Hydrogenispora sp.]
MSRLRFSIIINCYNTLPLIKKCLEAALVSTDQNSEIILINNHPPYTDAMTFLHEFKHPRVRILDPGQNIGCMPGFQYGAEHAQGQYLVKLDDDVLVPNKNWTAAMYQALKDFPKLAYVALLPAAIQGHPRQQVKKAGYTLEFRRSTILFWCMMIDKQLWRKHFYLTDLPLYGVGERHYERKANKLGLKKAYLTSHICTSLGRTEESDPLYGAWKLFYVKKKEARSDFETWKKSFVLGPAEAEIMRRFGYPEHQIAEVRTLLSAAQEAAQSRSTPEGGANHVP